MSFIEKRIFNIFIHNKSIADLINAAFCATLIYCDHIEHGLVHMLRSFGHTNPTRCATRYKQAENHSHRRHCHPVARYKPFSYVLSAMTQYIVLGERGSVSLEPP
jgi:hypothetical protein